MISIKPAPSAKLSEISVFLIKNSSKISENSPEFFNNSSYAPYSEMLPSFKFNLINN